MSELMDREVPIREVLATSPETAKALEDPVRAELLEMLAHEPMSVAEMVDRLEDRELARAPTTVRHHVDVLHEAGLIALKRLEEDRGGVVKYYAATTRLLDVDAPADLEEALDAPIEAMADELEAAVGRLRDEHGDALREMAAEMKPCPYCRTEHFEAYATARVVQAALARVLEDG